MQTCAKSESKYAFLPPLILFVVTLGLYIPSIIYFSNIDEFSIEYSQIIPIIIIPSFIIFLSLGIFLYFIRKFDTFTGIILDLLFGASLASYIQTSFLNYNLQQLNGSEMAWNYLSYDAFISIIIWLLCLIFPIVLHFKCRKIERMIIKYGSLILISFFFLLLLLTFFTTHSDKSNSIALSKEKEFELSSKDNTVVFVVDTLDAQWAETYILSNSTIMSHLDGFTYFNNVVGGGAPTILGIPAMLTGEIYNPNMSIANFYASAYSNSTLFQDLQKYNYSVKLFTSQYLIDGVKDSQIDNIVNNQIYQIDDKFKFAKSLFKLTAYLAVPYHLKEKFMIYSDILTKNIKTMEKNVNNYITNDPQFYIDFKQQGITTRNDKNVFVFYHLFGAHGPYNMNEEAEEVALGESSLKQQIVGTMKIITDFIDQMKEKGLYDNCTFIITADHGGVALYQNPAVFIKRKGEKKPFTINTAPVTFNNLRSSFVSDFFPNYKKFYGDSLFDVPENADIPYRKHTTDPVLWRNVFSDEKKRTSYIQYNIGNPARDNSLIIELDNFTRNPYKIGTTIYLYGDNITSPFYTDGFSVIENNYRWIDGKKAIIPLLIQEDFQDLMFSMNYTTFGKNQTGIIYANDKLIFEGLLEGGTLSDIVISEDCINSGELTLTFEMPNAISPKELGINDDQRCLSISIQSLCINHKTNNK